MPLSKNPAKQRAGKLGGQKTYERYGREHMSAMGKLGGRPRRLTADELMRLQAPVTLAERRAGRGEARIVEPVHTGRRDRRTRPRRKEG